MRITGVNNQYNNSYKGIHANKRAMRNFGYQDIKNMDVIKEAAKKSEVLIKGHNDLNSRFFIKSFLLTSLVPALAFSLSIFSTSLGLAASIGSGAFLALGAIFEGIQRYRYNYLTVQAGEELKKGLFGNLKLAGAKSKEYLYNHPHDVEHFDLDVGKCIRSDFTESSLYSDYRKGKIDDETFKNKVLASFDFRKDSKGYTNVPFIQELNSFLKDKPGLIKNILTSRPINNDENDLNLAERFIGNEKLRPILKKILGEDFDTYDKVCKERERLERIQNEKEVNDIFNSAKQYGLHYLMDKEFGHFNKVKMYPEKILEFLQSGRANLNNLFYDDLPKAFEHDPKMLTDFYITRGYDYHNPAPHICFALRNCNPHSSYMENVNNFLEIIKDDYEQLKRVDETVSRYMFKRDISHLDNADNNFETFMKTLHSHMEKFEDIEAEKYNNCPMNKDSIVEMLNRKDARKYLNRAKSFIPNVMDYLINSPLENKERKEIIKKLDCFNGIDYNKEDQFGVSILESVINAEDLELFTLMRTSGKKLKYYPMLDPAYANIQDKKFKKEVDRTINLDFSDLKAAIETSSKDALDKTIAQFNSPLMLPWQRQQLLDMVKERSLPFQAYFNVKIKELEQ